MFDRQPKDKDIYKSSRIMYILDAAFEYFISILTTGAYLAKLTSSIGISDGTTAILSTLGSLAGSLQVISIFLAHKTPVKRWVVPLISIDSIIMTLLYLIPFLAISPSATSVLFFVIVFGAQVMKSIASPAKTNWFMSLVNPRTRGAFSAALQAVSLIGGMIFTFVTGIVIDKYEAANNLKGAFIVLTITILCLALLRIICLSFAKEKVQPNTEKVSPLGEVKILIHNKRFIRYITVNLLWAISTSLSTPFFGTYQINELGFSMTLISSLSVAFSILQLIFTAIMGKLSLRYPAIRLLCFGYPISVLSYLVMVFTMPKNGIMMFIIYRVISIIGGAALTVGGTIAYDITRYRERTSALAINTILTGTVSFIVTLLATSIFNYVKSETVFGLSVYPQQFLSAITVIIGIAVTLYVFFFFAPSIKEEPPYSDEENE